jgi:hypothetical protein
VTQLTLAVTCRFVDEAGELQPGGRSGGVVSPPPPGATGQKQAKWQADQTGLPGWPPVCGIHEVAFTQLTT